MSIVFNKENYRISTDGVFTETSDATSCLLVPSTANITAKTFTENLVDEIRIGVAGDLSCKDFENIHVETTANDFGAKFLDTSISGSLISGEIDDGNGNESSNLKEISFNGITAQTALKAPESTESNYAKAKVRISKNGSIHIGDGTKNNNFCFFRDYSNDTSRALYILGNDTKSDSTKPSLQISKIDSFVSSPSCSLYVNGNVRTWNETAPTNTNYYGNVSANSWSVKDVSASTVKTNTITSYSDRRLKENIVAWEAVNDILELPLVEFDFKNDNTHSFGCIAQDLQKIIPEAVSEMEDGYLAIQESKIIYALISEIKKLKEKVKKREALKKRLEKLEQFFEAKKEAEWQR